MSSAAFIEIGESTDMRLPLQTDSKRETAAALDSESSCSTPSGIREICTLYLAGCRRVQGTVLNAFRHQRNLHAGAPLDPDTID